MTAFALGELARLKSGGPDMTVKGERSTAAGATLVLCSWFEGSKYRTEPFEAQLLDKVLAPAAPASAYRED